MKRETCHASENRLAVVTGAASGIDTEIARTFVREGAKVAIADQGDADGAATARVNRAYD